MFVKTRNHKKALIIDKYDDSYNNAYDFLFLDEY